MFSGFASVLCICTNKLQCIEFFLPTIELRIHIPDVTREHLNSGAEHFAGNVWGFDGEAESLCFSPHHIVKLVSKQWDCQHRYSMVYGLQQAVLSTMGDEKTYFCVTYVKQRMNKMFFTE